MKSFFIDIWIENVVTVQSKRTVGIFISYQGKGRRSECQAVCGTGKQERREK